MGARHLWSRFSFLVVRFHCAVQAGLDPTVSLLPQPLGAGMTGVYHLPHPACLSNTSLHTEVHGGILGPEYSQGCQTVSSKSKRSGK